MGNNPYGRPDQGFLDDYSGINAVGSAVQSFADSFEKAQDRSYKRLEQQAQMEALKTKMEREKVQNKVDLWKSHAQLDDSGNITDRPLNQYETEKENLEMAGRGLQKDPARPGKFIIDEKTPAAIAARNKGAALNNTVEQRTNNDWEKFSEKVNNPSARSSFGRYQQMIDKAGALKAFERGLGMPPGQLAPEGETQAQKIERYNRANPQDLYEMATAADQLVKNGASTVYGTEHLMPKDMGLAGSTIAQWVANKSVPAHQGEFIDKFMHMADRENSFYQQKRDKGLSRFVGGFEHLKKKDPSRWERILGEGAEAESAPHATPDSAQASPPQGGLVPKKPGLISGLIGSVFGSQADAAPKPDPQIEQWAKEHNMTYEAASNIIADRAAKKAQANGK